MMMISMQKGHSLIGIDLTLAACAVDTHHLPIGCLYHALHINQTLHLSGHHPMTEKIPPINLWSIRAAVAIALWVALQQLSKPKTHD